MNSIKNFLSSQKEIVIIVAVLLFFAILTAIIYSLTEKNKQNKPYDEEIDKLEKKLDNISENNDLLSEKIKKNESNNKEIKELKKKIDDLTEENDALGATLNSMEDKNKKLGKHVSKLASILKNARNKQIKKTEKIIQELIYAAKKQDFSEFKRLYNAYKLENKLSSNEKNKIKHFFAQKIAENIINHLNNKSLINDILLRNNVNTMSPEQLLSHLTTADRQLSNLFSQNSNLIKEAAKNIQPNGDIKTNLSRLTTNIANIIDYLLLDNQKSIPYRYNNNSLYQSPYNGINNNLNQYYNMNNMNNPPQNNNNNNDQNKGLFNKIGNYMKSLVPSWGTNNNNNNNTQNNSGYNPNINLNNNQPQFYNNQNNLNYNNLNNNQPLLYNNQNNLNHNQNFAYPDFE